MKSKRHISAALKTLDRIGRDEGTIEIAFDVRVGSKTKTIETNSAWQGGISERLFELASELKKCEIRFDTVRVQPVKLYEHRWIRTKGVRELRKLAIQSLSEVFRQPLPSAEKLKAAGKVFRNKIRAAEETARRERAAVKKREILGKERARKKIVSDIQKMVGVVSDVATLLRAISFRVDAARLAKVKSMLKADRFELFADTGAERVTGVVKSQTDGELVYACQITETGKYACCTQNLNACGGLRGAVCKHILVLIAGLVQAGKLDAGRIESWIARTHDVKPKLDRDAMGEVFIRYKGAEAGEVDWRPTETVPEDYYTL